MVELRKQPANLHISHSWGGGLGNWVKDFSQAERSALNLVLESVGTTNCYGIGHRLKNPCTGETLDEWNLPEPIAEVRGESAGYRERLQTVVERFDVRCLYVSSLIGHSLDVFRLGLPVMRTHHDFFPYCPALHCYFDGICSVCHREHLAACRNANSYFRPINSAQFFNELRSELLDAYKLDNVTHVVPSASVAHQLNSLDERFRELTFHIIEHGVDLPRINAFGGANPDRKLRVGLLGHLHWAKGVDVLRRELERLRLVANIILVGAGEHSPEFSARWAVEALPEYDRGDLPNLLSRLQLDLGLFLSIVPETYSYTLSEVLCLGIPPVAHGIGAFAERIQHRTNGFLFRWDNDGLVDEILRLDRSREEVCRIATRLNQERRRTTRNMVDDYNQLLAQIGRRESCQTESNLCDHRQKASP